MCLQSINCCLDINYQKKFQRYFCRNKSHFRFVQPCLYLWPCPRLSSWQKIIILTAADYLIAAPFPVSSLTQVLERCLHLYYWHPISYFAVSPSESLDVEESHSAELITNTSVTIYLSSSSIYFIELNILFLASALPFVSYYAIALHQTMVLFLLQKLSTLTYFY